jgi:hypothetical protein
MLSSPFYAFFGRSKFAGRRGRGLIFKRKSVCCLVFAFCFVLRALRINIIRPGLKATDAIRPPEQTFLGFVELDVIAICGPALSCKER